MNAYMGARSARTSPGKKKTMDRAWLNDMAKRSRINPTDVLKEVSRASLTVGVGPKVKGLRATTPKRRREIAEACLFCFGWACRIGRPVWVVDDEGADYDFVAVWKNNGDEFFTPVQLKEVVPTRLNPDASIQSIIDGLGKYSKDLSVAIRVNQRGMLDLDKITLPSSLKISALWVYAAVSEDGSRWWINGNLIEPGPDEGWFFDYPA
jgi:hypothetical protein